MNFNNRDDDDKGRDFFGDTEVPDKPVKAKPPRYKSDDPRYWSGEASRWDHLKPRPSKRFWLMLAGFVVIAVLLLIFWLRFFSPVVTDATQCGYVERIDRRGVVFKTYEGVLLPYKELRDTTRLYRRDFTFTAANVEVATEIKRLMMKHVPIRVYYKQYSATVPWRGASKIIVTGVDSVNPRTILPPEYQPENP